MERLVDALRAGYCVPAVTKLAKRLKQPGSTIHFNIKKMEKDGRIMAYKAVFDKERIGLGFTGFALVKLSERAYTDPDFTLKVGRRIAKHPEVESVDVLTGEWELIVKISAKDQKDYFSLVRRCIAGEGISKVNSLISLSQLKSEYVELRR